jgi:uncharacterized protein with PQ loop repeat
MAHNGWFDKLPLGLLLPSVIVLQGCESLGIHDTASLIAPTLRRSELVGLVAGFGTTFAALPDLLAMLKRRSSAGMNPRMAGIMCVFQVAWVYYGLLIASRPVVGMSRPPLKVGSGSGPFPTRPVPSCPACSC